MQWIRYKVAFLGCEKRSPGFRGEAGAMLVVWGWIGCNERIYVNQT
jgi:hypothetical protein